MYYPLIIKSEKNLNLNLLTKISGERPNSSQSEFDLFEALVKKEKESFKRDFRFGIYTPDILYFDKLNNIIIDIEIDEPYSFSGELTHAIDDVRDKSRNQYFHSNGVNVIRFSEKQIVSEIDKCCEIINLLIKSLNGGEYDHQIKRLGNAIIDNMWTKAQSEKMLKNEYRLTYPYKAIESEKSISRFTIKQSLSNYINIELLKLQDEDAVIIIPSKLVKLKHVKNEEITFLYKGFHFSLSEYCGYSNETTKVEIIDQSSTLFDIFEKTLNKRVTFEDSNYEYIPVLIINSLKNSHLPFSIEIKTQTI